MHIIRRIKQSTMQSEILAAGLHNNIYKLSLNNISDSFPVGMPERSNGIGLGDNQSLSM
jgi:hypothetical protein